MARTEKQSYMLELAIWLDFEVMDDDCTLFQCTDDQLIEFAERVERAAASRCGPPHSRLYRLWCAIWYGHDRKAPGYGIAECGRCGKILVGSD